MTNSIKLDDKICALEMKLSFQEDLLQTLNDVVTRQDREIQRLWAANRILKLGMNEMKHDSNEASQEPPPPHY